ncbi:MAG: GNAT family N-acetyltransferase [Micromonosporaceae bacterium]|nr:GNAT family N-acetyltransferase [Micromonosporaceae bacterium]
MGVVYTRLPGPRNLDSRVGYIQWVATDPAWRGRGYARAVLNSLLEWFRGEGVNQCELHATPAGRPLYESLGFGIGDHPGLRRKEG